MTPLRRKYGVLPLRLARVKLAQGEVGWIALQPLPRFLFAKDSCRDVSTIPPLRFARKLLAIRILDKKSSK